MAKIRIEQLTDEQKRSLAIPATPKPQGRWSVWECAPSKFDWHYDQLERAYVYEGKVRVKTAEGTVELKAGDFVTFPKGLGCTWEVVEKIRKVYCFE